MDDKTIHNNLINSSLKDGEPAAYKIIFDKYYKDLFSFINFYTNDNNKTEDIIQETFVRLWDKRDSIKQDISVIGFLYKVSYNIFVDNYRKEKREKSSLDLFAYDRLVSLIDEDEFEKNRRITKVRNAINDLPKRCKEVFEMSKFGGYKYSEISEKLNISIKTVEAQMGKAFSIIRNKIK